MANRLAVGFRNLLHVQVVTLSMRLCDELGKKYRCHRANESYLDWSSVGIGTAGGRSFRLSLAAYIILSGVQWP